MKLSWKILISLCALVPAAFIVMVAPAIRDQRQLLYPSPDSVSVFLKNYSPQSVIDKFKAHESSGFGGGKGSSAGRLFITNRYQYFSQFSIESAKQMPLMAALGEDINTQLVHNGATVIDHDGDPQKGYHFDYRLAKSAGTIRLFPMGPDPGVHRNTPSPEGISDVIVRIEVTERWFPYEAEATQASLPLH